MVAKPGQPGALSVLFFAALFLLTAAPVRAQGIGFQGGATIDPEQVYVGSHYETGEIGRRFHIRPFIDGGFGNDLRIATIGVDLLYKSPITQNWKIYTGIGPAVHIVRFEGVEDIPDIDDTDVTGGVFGVFGFAHESGLFLEFKGGGGGGPNLKFGVGFTIR
jgi:hypothetical protein